MLIILANIVLFLILQKYFANFFSSKKQRMEMENGEFVSNYSWTSWVLGDGMGATNARIAKY